jgi:SAM-dependent methyltransferase
MIYKYPKSFARFYDTIYHNLRDETDNQYFQDEIKSTYGKVLEIGAGTGRLFMNALNAGADIHAIDISESMLDVLYSKLPENQHFRVKYGNMTDFRTELRFDLILAPFRVLMHLLEKEEQMKALNNVYDHLNSGGRFIFDVFVPDLRQLVQGLENKMDFEGEYAPGMKIRRFASTKPDLISQTIEVDFHMEWEEGSGLKQDDWKLPLRFFFRYELEHLIERTKFERYEIFGDYNRSKLNKYSREFVVICHKA